MRFATSCFKTLVRSDLRRFWPIAFVYTAVWIIALPVTIWNECISWGNEPDLCSQIADITYNLQFTGVVIAVIFGVGMAMAVYSYLMTARSVGLLHSMPVKRSAQFFAHFTSGMGMLLFGNAVAFVLALLVEVMKDAVVLQPLLWWLLVVSLLDFFFLALGILSAMLTGWVLAVPVIYAAINFVAAAVQLLLQEMARNFYFGYNGGDLLPIVYWLTPAVKLGRELNGGQWYAVQNTTGMNMDSVKVVVIYAFAALALLACSFLLYRMRRSESAADPVAFIWAKPIFRCMAALLGGMALGLGLYSLLLYGVDSLALLVGCLLLMTVLCYIAAEMVIRKSFRVLRHSWKGLAALCVVLVLVCAGMAMDIFGCQTYVPEADEVKEIYVSASGNTEFAIGESADQDTIAAAIAMHEAILAQGLDQECDADDSESDVVSCVMNLKYIMQNGREVARWYNVCVERGSALHKAVNALAGTKAVRTTALLDNTPMKVEDIYGGYVSCYRENEQSYEKSLSEKQAQELYAALLRDIEQGHGRNDIVDNPYSVVEMSFDTERSDACISTLPPDCTETIAVLLEMGVAEKTEDLFY